MLACFKPHIGAGAALVVGLCACSPPLNWGEVQDEATGLTAQLPCRVERTTRSVTVRGKALVLRMIGCEADNTLFAISAIDFGDALQTQAALVDWQVAVREHLHLSQVPGTAARPFVPAGAAGVPASMRLQGTGQRVDGVPVQVDAAWFARDGQLFHAVVLAERLNASDIEPFFSGLQVGRGAH